MIRWRYLLPRLVFVLLLVSGLWWGLSPLLRWVLVRGGEAAVGARVELGDVQVNLFRTHVQLDQLRIADPDAPMKNLFQTERVLLDLDPAAALRRKLVVVEGSLTGIELNTRRETSGALEAPPEDEPSEGGSELWEDAAARGEAWLETSATALQYEFENELQTVQLTRDMVQRWPREYAQLETEAQQLERQARQLRDLVKRVKDRPLEHLDQIPPALAQLEQMRRDLLRARGELLRLQQQMREDGGAIAAAKDHDFQYVRERLKVPPLDGQALSDYLLGPVWGARVQTAVGWIQWLRQQAPEAPAERPAEPILRGLTVKFPGYHSTPDVIVRQLNLSGKGTDGGHSFTFTGQLCDLTSQPRLHSKPTSLQLESQGSIQLRAAVTMDRRGKVPRDRLVIDIPAMRQSEQVLGNPRRLAVTLAAGTVQVHAELAIVDQSVEGHIALRQQNLQLTTRLSDDYTRYVSSNSLQAALQPIQQLETQILVSGPLKRPRWKLQSNLGPQLAAGLQAAVRNELAEREQQLLAMANQRAEEELAKLQQQLAEKHQSLLQKLELGDEQLDQFKRQLLAQVQSPEQLIGQGKKLLDRMRR